MTSLSANPIFFNSLVSFFAEEKKKGDINNVISGAFVVTIIILFLGLYYKVALERTKNYKKLPKLVFLVFLFIRWIKKTTIELLGRRYSFAIPFFIYIVFYFWGSSLVGMFGFQGISAFAFVPLSIAAIVFVGTVISGIAARGWGFCKDYYLWFRMGGRKIFPFPDVPKIIGEIGKIISLGLRLWGNFFAGAIVLFIVKTYLNDLFKKILPEAGPWNIGNMTLVPLHFYFDIVDGALHSMIFLLLTFSYWKMAKQAEVESTETSKAIVTQNV